MTLSWRYTHLQVSWRKNDKKGSYFTIDNSSNLILVGDFNTTLTKIDRITGENIDTEVQKELEGILNEFDLQDHWRLQNPKERLYMHYRGRTGTYACLDRAYIATKVRTHVRITPDINSFSDYYHSVVIKRLTRDFERGKGYWILIMRFWKTVNIMKKLKNSGVTGRNKNNALNLFRNGGFNWEVTY